ncbi:bifunctional hydroxymethylpyrimidine kinase/phosphomethylpyrimidine kinase [Roseomonas aeriglobus]|nr:bifunctional hydroxymethylpyrimidine kinase/phosphomethylpyrimidine kinase [Roseomonas aeriglobus]
MTATPRVLIVAGSDSGGGAGIQADIKTVTMLGGHAMTAITALTAQNTLGVQGVMPVRADFVVQQMRSCIDDIGVDAVKIGMIGSADVAHVVADVLEGLDAPVVFDPVMIATSGAVLADDATIAAFERLMRRATVVTPNLPELAALGGEAAVLGHGPSLLIKGGHADGEDVVDRIVTAQGEVARWSNPRIHTPHTHGTGCTLASAIATGLGGGLSLPTATERAIRFVRASLEAAPGLGQGHGPMGQQAAKGF